MSVSVIMRSPNIERAIYCVEVADGRGGSVGGGIEQRGSSWKSVCIGGGCSRTRVVRGCRVGVVR
jgi:hypothetical protein